MSEPPERTQQTPWHDARRISYDSATALDSEEVPLSEAVGRTLTHDLTALHDVPHYASSAMDGWAVSGEAPWTIGTRATLATGEATPIVTGGLVPIGTRGVLRSEQGIAASAGGVRLLTLGADAEPGDPAPGLHIRPAGEEITHGEVAYPASTVLNPAHAAVAAVCGWDSLQVSVKPRIRLIFTGDEVVTSGIPEPGTVRDTFGMQLPALVGMFGGTVVPSIRLPDDENALVAALESDADGHDVIITTGGTGASSADHLHAALSRVGATIIIDGVGMRPGAPSLLASLPGGRYVIGLPGNPLAAIMGALTLAGPLLDRLQSRKLAVLDTIIMGSDLGDGRGRIRLIPYLEVHGNAVPSKWHGSGMMRGLADATGVLVCPPEGAARGVPIERLRLPWST